MVLNWPLNNQHETTDDNSDDASDYTKRAIKRGLPARITLIPSMMFPIKHQALPLFPMKELDHREFGTSVATT